MRWRYPRPTRPVTLKGVYWSPISPATLLSIMRLQRLHFCGSIPEIWLAISLMRWP